MSSKQVRIVYSCGHEGDAWRRGRKRWDFEQLERAAKDICLDCKQAKWATAKQKALIDMWERGQLSYRPEGV